MSATDRIDLGSLGLGVDMFRLMADHAPSMLWVADVAGRVAGFNRAWYEFTGRTPAQDEGDGWTELLHPDDREVVERQWQETVGRREPCRSEYRLRRADGEYRWIMDDGRPVLDERGGLKGFVGSCRDVTEVRQAADELRTSAAALRDVAAAIPGVLYQYEIRTDGSSRYSYVSEGARELLGVDPGYIMADGLSIYNMVDPAQVPGMRREGEAALREGRPSEHDVEIRRPDGGIRQVRIRASARPERGGVRVWTGLIIDVSDERRIAEALARSQERAELALETVADGLWDWNMQTGSLYVAPKNMHMLGYEAGEIPMNRIEQWRTLWHPEDRPEIERRQRDHFEGRTPAYELERRLRHKDGHYIWVMSRGRVVQRGPGGEPLRMVGTNLDMTARRHHERALRESEERFRAAFEHAATGIAMVDPAGHFLGVNEALCGMLGYSEAELLGRNVAEVTHAEDLPRNLRLRSDLTEGRIPAMHMAKRYLRKDGGVLWAHLSVAPLRDGSGALTGFISQVMDISAQRSIENELRDSVERFRVLADMAPVGIYLTDASGGATYVNPRWLEMAGLSAERSLGRGWLTAVHPEDRERVQEEWDRWHTGLHTGECRYLTPGGVVRWVYTTSRPLRDVRGAITGYLGTVTDVTELKEAESRVRQSLAQREDLLRREASLRRELDHRVRNNLAALLGLVGLYERSGRHDGSLSEALRGKLLAMREVHEVIARAPGSPVGLESLVQRLAAQLLTPVQLRSVSTRGPSLHIPSPQAGAVAMIMQEFFTNARKHGCMKLGAGAIGIEWEVETMPQYTGVRLVWSESGGPPAHAPPVFGVGLHLVRGFAAAELRGSCEFRFGEEGFSCILRAKLAGSSAGTEFAGEPDLRGQGDDHEQPAV